jgi:hypothetical protein
VKLTFTLLILTSMLNAATLYVVNGLDESLGWINTHNGQSSAQSVTLGNIPNDVAVTENQLFVINTGLNTLQIIDRNSLTTIDEISLTGTVNPWAVAVINDRKVAVTGSVSGTVAIVDFLDRSIDTTFVTGTGPQSVAVRSNGLFVLNTGVQFPSYSYGELRWYDLNTFALIDTFSVNVNAQFMEFLGDELHISCTGNYIDIPGTIEIVNLHNHAERTTIHCGGTPGAISIFGANAFVSAGGWGDSGAVYRYNAATKTLINGENNPISCGVGASDVQALTDGSFAVSCFNSANVEIRDENGAWLHTYEMSAGASTMCVWWDAFDDSPDYPELPKSVELVKAYPNPFNSTVNFEIPGRISSNTTLKIFDLNGRLITELSLGAGQNRVSWQAQNRAGQEVATGAYFVTLAGAQTSASTRIVYLK